MKTTESPGRPEIVRRATDLVDLIRKHAAWQEENRVLHEEVLEGVADAGLLKLRVPARYGGHEADMGTVVEVISELSRGDGSLGWVFNAWMNGCWLVGLLPDEAQDEIFADPKGVGIGLSVSPGGTARPTAGGVVLNGRWPFCSGVLHGPWFVHSAVLVGEDGGRSPVMVTVPASDLGVVDDWHTAGLRATGSVTTVAEDLFVPDARVLPMVPLLAEGRHRSRLNADSPVWQAPFSPAASAVGSAPALGVAQAAWDVFFERLPERRITFTRYERQTDAPLTHHQVAEAAMKIDEAGFHVRRVARRVDAKTAAGESWTAAERAMSRLDMGAATQLAKEAVDVLKTASGGSSIYADAPIQRIERDVLAINLHGVLHPNTNMELYGRVRCGLEPNTDLL
ncbi:acyl-CoA dehydrogenase family protein [Saccharothrix australiensis]|uniref:Alkylation response protein AidB-like acyl-CoA dehydrogenase n=1 Tax=Saccharothrix australiensis TaxID=2072 RepID=A0A495W0G5_9PSEU|nr:acyl-CoA dehydrogenase family protein [Saccharothrix australiensis]RKT55191.1 alkylation response protein AidB-like acyl-CoA dehydrogenase [Saccharothrix australiensis]